MTAQTFWLAAGLGFRLIVDSPFLVPAVLVGLIAEFVFYWTYRVAGRELGRSAASFWFPFGRDARRRPFLQRASEDWSVPFKIIDPRWWHSVVAPATRWPVMVVDMVMIAGLMGIMASATISR